MNKIYTSSCKKCGIGAVSLVDGEMSCIMCGFDQLSQPLEQPDSDASKSNWGRGDSYGSIVHDALERHGRTTRYNSGIHGRSKL